MTDDQKAMIEIEWAKQYEDEGLAAKSEGGKKSAPGRPSKDVNERSQVSPRAPTSRKKMAAEAGVSERKIQQAALAHPKGAGMSDNQIAKHVGVSQPTVASWRAKLEPTSKVLKSTKRTGRDGRTIDTTNIGRRGSGSTQAGGA